MNSNSVIGYSKFSSVSNFSTLASSRLSKQKSRLLQLVSSLSLTKMFSYLLSFLLMLLLVSGRPSPELSLEDIAKGELLLMLP